MPGYEPPDPVFISDRSLLIDFGDDDVVADLLPFYGVDVSDPESVFIADILERVRAARQV